MTESEIESDWDDYLSEYRIRHPFTGEFKAIKISEDDVGEELLEKCIGKHVVAEVSKGYFISPRDIEKHLEVINERGMKAYLEKRLELVEDG